MIMTNKIKQTKNNMPLNSRIQNAFKLFGCTKDYSIKSVS